MHLARPPAWEGNIVEVRQSPSALALIVVAIIGLVAASAIPRFAHAADQSTAPRLPVDTLLVLAIDCSLSIDADEFKLQMNATANALRRKRIVQAIRNGRHGRVAIAVVQWSGLGQQFVSIPWTVIADSTDASALATRLSATARHIAGGSTSLGGAIAFSTRLIATSPFPASRHVIDISSDGPNNQGSPPWAERNAAIAAGITINALPILSRKYPELDRYYVDNVTGGPGTFVEIATEQAAYPHAIYRKLLKELQGPIG